MRQVLIKENRTENFSGEIDRLDPVAALSDLVLVSSYSLSGDELMFISRTAAGNRSSPTGFSGYGISLI